MDDLDALTSPELVNLSLNLLELMQLDNGNLLSGDDLAEYTALIGFLIKRSHSISKSVA